MADDTSPPELACVVLAHDDPEQVHRLVEALAPFPVLVHVDARATPAMFEAITRGLPERCVVLPRVATAWATFGQVEAEIEGYRAALLTPGISHIALMTGVDYPTATIAEIRGLLREHRDDSFVVTARLPYAKWGRSGGFSRLRYRHWARGKRMLRLPIPRRIPRGVVFAGGSSSKVLTLEHAAAVVAAYDSHPELVRFWRRAWAPDETFVQSILSTPQFVPGWAEHTLHTHLWWIDWGDGQKKSPPWVTMGSLPSLLRRRFDDEQEIPFVFARKFSTEKSSPVMDELDRAYHLRGETRVASGD